MKNSPQIEKILTREEFRRSTMGCFYQDELRAHDRAMRKRLAAALEEQTAEIERWLVGMMAMYEHQGFTGKRVCEKCREIVEAGTPCEQSVYLHTWRKLAELRAKLAEMKEGKL